MNGLDVSFLWDCFSPNSNLYYLFHHVCIFVKHCLPMVLLLLFTDTHLYTISHTILDSTILHLVGTISAIITINDYPHAPISKYTNKIFCWFLPYPIETLSEIMGKQWITSRRFGTFSDPRVLTLRPPLPTQFLPHNDS